MTALQRKAILVNDKFICHKKNGKGNTLIFSRNHPTAKFVRVVVDSGIDKTSGKIVSNASVKLCYINIQKSWREITPPITTDTKGLASLVTKVEAAEKFVKSCKFCKAKKFTAKSGKVVCANACWTKWGGKKKSATTQKKKPQKSSQKIAAQKTKAPSQKKSQKVTPKSHRKYPRNKRVENSSQKKAQKFAAEILPGDLVTIQEIIAGEMTQDFTGSVLGIVQWAQETGYVKVHWTANTTEVEDYMLPTTNCYYMGNAVDYRLKVLSRPVEYALVS